MIGENCSLTMCTDTLCMNLIVFQLFSFKLIVSIKCQKKINFVLLVKIIQF